MKFLVDECTGKRLAKLLEKAGFDVVFVGDWKPSATDDEVFEKAEKEDRILIFRLGKPSKGVILLRLSTTDPMKRFRVLNEVLKLVDVKGKFVVVGDEAVKVRKIER